MSGRGVEEVVALRVGARQVVLDVEADDVAAPDEASAVAAAARWTPSTASEPRAGSLAPL